jgi:hypothetical protein
MDFDRDAWLQRVADNPHMIWCRKVAGLGVASLVTANLLQQSAYEQAKEIVAEEIFVRMCLNDLPPVGQAGDYPGRLTRLP